MIIVDHFSSPACSYNLTLPLAQFSNGDRRKLGFICSFLMVSRESRQPSPEKLQRGREKEKLRASHEQRKSEMLTEQMKTFGASSKCALLKGNNRSSSASRGSPRGSDDIKSIPEVEAGILLVDNEEEDEEDSTQISSGAKRSPPSASSIPDVDDTSVLGDQNEGGSTLESSSASGSDDMTSKLGVDDIASGDQEEEEEEEEDKRTITLVHSPSPTPSLTEIPPSEVATSPSSSGASDDASKPGQPIDVTPPSSPTIPPPPRSRTSTRGRGVGAAYATAVASKRSSSAPPPPRTSSRTSGSSISKENRVPELAQGHVSSLLSDPNFHQSIKFGRSPATISKKSNIGDDHTLGADSSSASEKDLEEPPSDDFQLKHMTLGRPQRSTTVPSPAGGRRGGGGAPVRPGCGKITFAPLVEDVPVVPTACAGDIEEGLALQPINSNRSSSSHSSDDRVGRRASCKNTSCFVLTLGVILVVVGLLVYFKVHAEV